MSQQEYCSSNRPQDTYHEQTLAPLQLNILTHINHHNFIIIPIFEIITTLILISNKIIQLFIQPYNMPDTIAIQLSLNVTALRLSKNLFCEIHKGLVRHLEHLWPRYQLKYRWAKLPCLTDQEFSSGHKNHRDLSPAVCRARIVSYHDATQSPLRASTAEIVSRSNFCSFALGSLCIMESASASWRPNKNLPASCSVKFCWSWETWPLHT